MSKYEDDTGMKVFLVSVAARNHVNRMCLAADIPLIESGTAGYLGQVTVIKKVEVMPVVVAFTYVFYTGSWQQLSRLKRCCSVFICVLQGMTECYECQPKPTQKTFPGCTIRNTPSEPIHCIVWAKYLFK